MVELVAFGGMHSMVDAKHAFREASIHFSKGGR
jgi:hypothetical protein